MNVTCTGCYHLFKDYDAYLDHVAKCPKGGK